MWQADARTHLDMRRPGPRVVRLDGAAAGNLTGAAVSGVGDVDGNGLDDVLIGAPAATGTNSRGASGVAYLLLARPRLRAVLDLRRLGNGVVVRIDGAAPGDLAGSAVAAAGDIDRDGIPDLLVGAPGATSRGREAAGAAFVALGRRPAPKVLDLGRAARILRIDGASGGDQAGAAVAGPGDMNDDGVPDVLVGAPGARGAAGPRAGAAYLVNGPASATVDLAALSPGAGLRLEGPVVGAAAGTSVVGAAEFAPRGSLLLGAPRLRPDTTPAGAGAVYGGGPPATAAERGSGPRGTRLASLEHARQAQAIVAVETARGSCPTVHVKDPQRVLRNGGVSVKVTGKCASMASASGKLVAGALTMKLGVGSASLKKGSGALFVPIQGPTKPFKKALGKKRSVRANLTVYSVARASKPLPKRKPVVGVSG